MLQQSFSVVKRSNIYLKTSLNLIYQSLTAKIDGNALVKKIIVNFFRISKVLSIKQFSILTHSTDLTILLLLTMLLQFF